MTHKINLGQGAVKYLRDMLAGSGWAKNVSDIILGGGLLVEKVPEVIDPPTMNVAPGSTQDAAKEATVAHRAAVKAWAAVAVPEFEINEKQREACRKCIKHFADSGAIPPTSQAAELLMAFGFTVD